MQSVEPTCYSIDLMVTDLLYRTTPHDCQLNLHPAKTKALPLEGASAPRVIAYMLLAHGDTCRTGQHKVSFPVLRIKLGCLKHLHMRVAGMQLML